MRKLYFILSICFPILAAYSQKADILVNYDYIHPSRSGKVVKNDMSLLASASESKYFNEVSLWVDSLKSTPDGNAKYMEIFKKSCMTIAPDGSMSIDMRKGPVKKVYSYVFNEQAENSVTLYDRFGDELGYYEESSDGISWEIVGDSVTNVLGYECVMAETDYHGRHWKAWFTTDIPMPYGPWKLRGLPGLILKAEANGDFKFIAKSIEKTDRIISPIYMKKDYSKVDRKKALEEAEYHTNNGLSILSAKYGSSVKVPQYDANGNEISIPKYEAQKHAIEPDYKK